MGDGLIAVWLDVAALMALVGVKMKKGRGRYAF